MSPSLMIGGGAIAATEFTSEIDFDYEGTGSDHEFDPNEEYVFDFSSGSFGDGEDHDMTQNHGDAGGSRWIYQWSS